MALYIRAIYEKGHLKLLEPVNLADGQQVQVKIETPDEASAVRAALAGLARLPDPNYNEHSEVEAMWEEIDQAFQGGKPLSEIIIEDRGES